MLPWLALSGFSGFACSWFSIRIFFIHLFYSLPIHFLKFDVIGDISHPAQIDARHRLRGTPASRVSLVDCRL